MLLWRSVCDLEANVSVFLSPGKRIIVLRVKVKEIIKLLEADGWYLARTKGSHRQFKHAGIGYRYSVR